MKGKSKMQRVSLWYWPPVRIGMALIMFFALFCAGGMNTAAAAPGKQPGKAPAEAAPGRKSTGKTSGKTGRKSGKGADRRPAG